MVLDWLFEGQNIARLGKGLLLTAQISLLSVAFSCVFSPPEFFQTASRARRGISV